MSEQSSVRLAEERNTPFLDVVVLILTALAVAVWASGPLGVVFIPAALVAAGVAVRRRGHRNLEHAFYIAAILDVSYTIFIFIGIQGAT